MTLFSNMSDVTTYNAYVMHSEIYTSYNAKLKYKRRIFLAELGESLISEEIITRKTGPQGKEAAKLSKSLQSPIVLPCQKRGRYFICKNDCKYSSKCDKCSCFMCRALHSLY